MFQETKRFRSSLRNWAKMTMCVHFVAERCAGFRKHFPLRHHSGDKIRQSTSACVRSLRDYFYNKQDNHREFFAFQLVECQTMSIITRGRDELGFSSAKP